MRKHMFFEDEQDSEKMFYEAKVLRVIDGDTIDVRHNNTKFRIRVEGIDAPESNQPFGWEATTFLHELIHGKEVYVSVSDIGKYERHVGKVLDQDFNNIAKDMLKSGMAWYMAEKKDFNPDMKALQTQAHQEKQGLWSGRNPINPKTWRDNKMSMSDYEKEALKKKKEQYQQNNNKTPIPDDSDPVIKGKPLNHIEFSEKKKEKSKPLSIRFSRKK